MGAISSIIKSLDSSDQLQAAQIEALTNLEKLAESRADYFKLQLKTDWASAGTVDNKTLPIEAVLEMRSQTHAYSQQSVQQVGKTVEDTITAFCSGQKDEIIKGVGGLITSALTVFLGEATGDEQTDDWYYIMTEGVSVVRVDLHAWKMGVTAQSLISKIEMASAFVYARSTVDLSQVKFNTFLNLYSRQLSDMKLPDQNITTELEAAQNIYDRFHGKLGLLR
jgi:hypothetical protein